jgi:GTPase SAR1 family protein
MIEVKNYTKYIKTDKKIKNLSPLICQWAFRLLIIGPSGSGKTNMCIDLILNHIYYDKIYIFAKDIEEPLYDFLKDFFIKCKKKIEKETKTDIEDIALFSTDLKDLPNIDEIDKKKQHLIIFDDFVTEKDQDKIKDIFIRGRKKNISTIYLTQSYFDVPKIIRLNSQYFAIFKLGDKKELRSIADTHSNAISFDNFMKLYKEIIKEPFQFMLIDKVSTIVPLQIRKGWSGLLNDKNIFDF